MVVGAACSRFDGSFSFKILHDLCSQVFQAR